jgi:hypothetical protein
MLIVKDVFPVSQNASSEPADRGEISQLWQELPLYYLSNFRQTLALFPRGRGQINFRIALYHHLHGVNLTFVVPCIVIYFYSNNNNNIY